MGVIEAEGEWRENRLIPYQLLAAALETATEQSTYPGRLPKVQTRYTP